MHLPCRAMISSSQDQIHLENGSGRRHRGHACCLPSFWSLLVVWLVPAEPQARKNSQSRPTRRACRQSRSGMQRIDDVVARHAPGSWSARRLSHSWPSIARDFASTATGNGRAQPDAHRHRSDASDRRGEPAGSHLAQADHRGIVSAGIRGCRAQSHRQAGHGRAGWRMGGQSCGKVAIDATVMALALGLSGRRHRACWPLPASRLLVAARHKHR